MVAKFQTPCRSGRPSGVRGGVHVFTPAVLCFTAEAGACPARGTCVSEMTIRVVRALVDAKTRRPIMNPLE
jgi:hypothetical protein